MTTAAAAIVVTLPLPPNMANMRAHWRVKENKRKTWFTLALAWEYKGRDPFPWDVIDRPYACSPRPAEPIAFANVAFALHMHSRQDDDNALARCKWPLDFLVRAGYLVDDDQKHCRLSIPEQVIDRKHPRIVVRITPEDG